MNIVISTDKLARGGKEKQLVILASELLKRNYNVSIISAHELDSENHFAEFKFPLEKIYTLSKSKVKNTKKLFKKTLIKLNPNVVLVWDLKSYIWAEQLKKKLKTMVIINCSIRRGVPYDSVKHRVLSWYIAKKSTFNVANSKAGLKLYKLEENENNKVIYNALPDTPNETKANFESIFKKSKKEGDVLIASVANLYSHKNQVSLLQAIKKLNNPKYHAVLVGDGDDKHALQRFISENKLEKQISLMGRQNDVFPYLNAADLYVNTSSGEGCSNALLEAISCGLPVITTPNGGTTEITLPQHTRFFNFNDSNELALAIKEMAHNRKLDQDEIAKWKEKFNPQVFTDEFESLIKKAIA